MEAFGSPSDCGFGEARDLKEAASDGRIACGVERGGRLRLVGSDGRGWIKVGARADGHFDFEEGALGFNDAVPAEGGTGFGEGGDFARKFTAISAGFESGDGVAVENEARSNIEKQGGERKGRAEAAAGTFATGTDFFGDQPGE